MKNIKSIFTLLIALILTVSLLGTSVMAVTTVYDGTTDPGKTGVTLESNGIGGKDSADKYFANNTACTSRTTSFTLTNYANTLECQFMLSSETAALQVRMIMHGTAAKSSSGNYSYIYLEVNADTMGFYYKGGSASAWNAMWEEDVNLVPGRWYTLVAKFGDLSASDGQQQAEYYINGELIHSGSELSNLYGIRNWSFGPKEADNTLYIDNITTSNGRGVSSSDQLNVDIARHTPSVVTSAPEGISFNNETKVITANQGVTAGEIIAGLTTSDGTDDSVKVYGAASCLPAEELADNALITDDSVVVIASKNGKSTEQAYNYYSFSLINNDNELGKGGNPADIIIASGTYNVSSQGGVYGKSPIDEAYVIEQVESGEGISLANTIFGKSTCGGSYGIIKMQFALTEGADLTVHVAHNPDAGNYSRFNFSEGEITMGSKFEASTSAPIETGKWHNLCIVSPVSDDKNGIVNIYLDGEHVRSLGIDESWYGLRRPFMVVQDAPVYIDNLEVIEGNTYDPSEDATSWIDIDNAIAQNGKLSYTAMPAAADFNTSASQNLRFYDASWNILADTTGAKYFVLGDKDAADYETKISYYTIDDEASDYIAGGYYNKDNSFYAVAYGKNAGDNLYFATYENTNDELDTVYADEIDQESSKAELTGTLTTKPYRVFFWDEDLKPLVKKVSLEFRK